MWAKMWTYGSFAMRSRVILLVLVALFLFNMCLTLLLFTAQQRLRGNGSGGLCDGCFTPQQQQQAEEQSSAKTSAKLFNQINMSLLMRANAMLQHRQRQLPQESTQQRTTTANNYSSRTRRRLITCIEGRKPHNFQHVVLLAGNITSPSPVRAQDEEAEGFRLTIGISSVARPDGTFYLYDTLQSIFSALRPTDVPVVNVVLMLAHEVQAERDAVLGQVMDGFRQHITNGLLHIIRKPEKPDFYDESGHNTEGRACYNCLFPHVEKVMPSHGDEPERRRTQSTVVMINNNKEDANVSEHAKKSWRAQQSLDYAFLWDYAAIYLAQNPYYLQLEDDITAGSEFVRHIRMTVMAIEAGKSTTNNQPASSSASVFLEKRRTTTSSTQQLGKKGGEATERDKNKLVLRRSLSFVESETGNERMKYVDDNAKSTLFMSSAADNKKEVGEMESRHFPITTSEHPRQQQKTQTPNQKWALIEFAVLASRLSLHLTSPGISNHAIKEQVSENLKISCRTGQLAAASFRSVVVDRLHLTSFRYKLCCFIGKLFHTDHLQKLAGLARVFYDDVPVDWLLVPWRHLMGQPEPIAHLSGSLFQHNGVVSSLPGRVQLLREGLFVGGDPMSSMKYEGDNPPAFLNTDVIAYESSPLLQSVYAPLLGARAPFWFKAPRKGNWITIGFLHPVRLKKIIIDSGELKRQRQRNEDGIDNVVPVLSNALKNDFAIATSAEPGFLGSQQLQAHENIKVCTFNATGMCYADDLHKVYSFRVSQLHIRFETNYTHDAVINEIGVFTYKKSSGNKQQEEDPEEVMLTKRKAYDQMMADVIAKNMDFLL